jgi:hypothetical protein
MNWGRVLAVALGIILLFPGLCFGFFGITLSGSGGGGVGLLLIAIALGIFWLSWWLFTKGAREPEPSVRSPTEESPKEQEPPSSTEPPKTE